MRLLACLVLAIYGASGSLATTITFEGLPSSDFGMLGLNGVTLDGATFYDFEAAKASNIYHTPPVPAHSGQNVALESYGAFPPQIQFVSPVNSVGAYFNYFNWDVSRFCLLADDASGNQIGEACSRYNDNLGQNNPWPYAPNEYLSVTSSTPISALRFQYGDESGYYFTIDDLTFSADTPEPGTESLIGIGTLLALCAGLRRLRGCGHGSPENVCVSEPERRWRQE